MAIVSLNRRTFLLSTAAAAGLGLSSSYGFAQDNRVNHAVLIGVTKYPNLPKKYELVGPKNDAALVYEFLTTRAPVKFLPENIAALAEGFDNAPEPTLANIYAAFEALAAKAKPGDFVYIHLSGHGTQQPASDKSSEQSGLDQLFMPADSAMADKVTKTIPNALVDNEIGRHLDAIRGAGAFVWITFDCCNSGTATRAASVADDDVTERMVNAVELGFTPEEMETAATQAEASRGEMREGMISIRPTSAEEIPGKGGLVAFFAAQNIEPTPEMKQPKGDPAAQKLGLFTYTLLSAIAEAPTATYRQIGQRIMQAYIAANRTYPTPLFEGDLDRPVFGMDSRDFIQQWPIETVSGTLAVSAGLLHRLSPGSKLAVLRSATATNEEAIGYLEVTSATNLSAKLAPTRLKDGDRLIVAGAIPAGAYARPVEVAMTFQLTVARPDASEKFAAETATVVAALEAIAADPDSGANIALVDPGRSADLKLAVMSEEDVAGLVVASGSGLAQGKSAGGALPGEEPRLWLLPSTAEISLAPGRRPPSIMLTAESLPNLEKNVVSSLIKIYRSTSVSRLSAANTFSPDDVDLQFVIKRPATGAEDKMLASEVPFARPGDEIHFRATNKTGKPIDVNVLYVGSDYSISFMPISSEDQGAARLHPQQEVDVGVLRFTDKTFGRERMIAVLTEAEDQTVVQDLAFLAQDGVEDTMRNLRAGTANPLLSVLEELGTGAATRSGVSMFDAAKPASRGAVLVFELETKPAA